MVTATASFIVTLTEIGWEYIGDTQDGTLKIYRRKKLNGEYEYHQEYIDDDDDPRDERD